MFVVINAAGALTYASQQRRRDLPTQRNARLPAETSVMALSAVGVSVVCVVAFGVYLVWVLPSACASLQVLLMTKYWLEIVWKYQSLDVVAAVVVAFVSAAVGLVGYAVGCQLCPLCSRAADFFVMQL